MIQKLGLILAVALLIALTIWIFQGWRLASLEILPIDIPWC